MKNRNLLLVLLLTIVSCKLPKKTLSKQELLKVEIELFFKEIRDNIDSRNLDYFESYFYENPREYSMEATESLKNKRMVKSMRKQFNRKISAIHTIKGEYHVRLGKEDIIIGWKYGTIVLVKKEDKFFVKSFGEGM